MNCYPTLCLLCGLIDYTRTGLQSERLFSDNQVTHSRIQYDVFSSIQAAICNA